MKKVLLILSLSLLTAGSAYSDVFQVDGLYYNSWDGKTFFVTYPPEGQTYSGDIIIPETVTSIGGWASRTSQSMPTLTTRTTMASIMTCLVAA